MKAIDLIIELQKLPANMEVMIDCTQDGTMFHFKEIAQVEQVEVESLEDIIVLFPFEDIKRSEN